MSAVPQTFAFGGGQPLRRLGFGTMRLTGPGIWGDPPDRMGAVDLLRKAVAGGVQFIDTADSYGPETSEALVADALHPYPADVLVATKGGFTRQGPARWAPDGRPEHLRAACEASLRRLRLEAIPLYYFHTPDPDVPFEESVGALRELRDAGLIRNAGLSNVDAAQLRAAQEIVPVAAVQNRHNLADRSAEVLSVCEEQGIAFVPWYPLANGRLTAARSRALERIAAAHAATAAQIALAWLLHSSPVSMPIPGTANIAHMRQNLGAAEIRLSDDDVEQLNRMRPPRRLPEPVRRLAHRIVTRLPIRR